MSDWYIGEVRIMTTPWAPKGWVPCDGRILPVQSNTALFSLIGNAFGGTYPNTFAVPDLRGRFVLGQGIPKGTSTDYPVGQTTTAESTSITDQRCLPAHVHQGVCSANPASPATLSISVTSAAGTQTQPGGNVLAQTMAAGVAANTYEESSKATGSLGGVHVAGPSGSTPVQVGNAGGSAPIPIMPPYTTLNYMIATVGIYPSRP